MTNSSKLETTNIRLFQDAIKSVMNSQLKMRYKVAHIRLLMLHLYVVSVSLELSH